MSDENQRKRPGLVEDRRGGLVGGDGAPPAKGLTDPYGPDTLRDGSTQQQKQHQQAAAQLAALRQLLLDPASIATTNIIMASGRHRRTLELLDLSAHRPEIHRGTVEPAVIQRALKSAVDLVAQLQQSNKAYLKHDQLKRNASALTAWLDEMRKLRDRVNRDLANGAAEFRAFVVSEEQKADEHEAGDAIRMMAKVGVISGEVWQNLVSTFAGRVAPDRLLALARTAPKLGPSWQPPANRGEVDALLKCVAWVNDDESFRAFSAEPPPVTERELLQASIKDVHERAAHLVARFNAAEPGAPELIAARTDSQKVASWLSIMDVVAKAAPEDAAARVAKVVWMERSRRFRRDMLAHIRKKYDNDNQIDFGEWVSLRDRAEEVIENDKAGAHESLVMLCREVTKDPKWEPPIDPKLVIELERTRREEAERRASNLVQAQVRGEGEAKRQYERQLEAQLAEKEREHALQRERERAEHERRFAQQVSAHKEAEKREIEADQASQVIEHMTGKQPRIFLGGGIGAALGVVVMLALGGILGHAFSPESRMSLAAARAPLAGEQTPDRLRVVCAKKSDRDARLHENTQAMARAVGSIRPPAAASSVAHAAASVSCATPPAPAPTSSGVK